MRLVNSPTARTTYLLLSLSVLLVGDAVRFTTGWWTFGVLAVVSGAASVALLFAHRERWRFGTLPYPLIAFVAFATLSLAWSYYRPSSGLGLLTTWLIAITALAIAISFTWRQLARGLSIVLKATLGLSLLFELFVSVVVRAPILPLFTQPGVDYSLYDTIPKMLYWSRNELFEVFSAGRIQGIVGNANNLGFLALIALIVFALELADRTVRKRWGLPWLVVAGATLVFTRSGTVTLALVAVLVVLGAALLVRRAATPRARGITVTAIVACLAAIAVAVVSFQGLILAALGKSADLTGRVGIWQSVIELAGQRPVAGWGWVSFWMPWAAPFDTLAFRNGVRQLQAHNVWIDVWFQLGVIGLVVFAALVVSATIRVWLLAADRPQAAPGERAPYTALALLPLLMLAALLVQSIAESRLIVEYGWAFLVIFAVKSKRQDTA